MLRLNVRVKDKGIMDVVRGGSPAEKTTLSVSGVVTLWCADMIAHSRMMAHLEANMLGTCTVATLFIP